MPYRGIERLQAGLDSLHQGFKTIRENRDKRQELQQLNEGIRGMSEAGRALGGTPEQISMMENMARVSGGKGIAGIVNATLNKQFSMPAQQRLLQVYQQYQNDVSSGDLSPERKAYYMDQINNIIKVDNTFRSALKQPDVDEYEAKRGILTKAQKEVAKYKMKLGIEAAGIRQKNWLKYLSEHKADEFDVEKARVPQTFNKEAYPDGMNRAEVEMKIRNENPELTPYEVADLAWIYENRDKDPARMQRIFEMLQMDHIATFFNKKEEAKSNDKNKGKGNTESSYRPPAGGPTVVDQLDALEDDDGEL